MISEEIGFRCYFSAIKKRKTLIIQIVITFTLLVLILSVYKRIFGPEYKSQAEILINQSSATSSSPITSFISSLVGKSNIDIDTQKALLNSPEIGKQAARILKGKYQSNELISKIEISSIPNTSILLISASGNNPKDTKLIVDAFAKAYLYWTNRENLININLQQEAVYMELQKTQNSIANMLANNSKVVNLLQNNPYLISTLYGGLVQRYSDLEILKKSQASSIKVLSWGEIQKKPYSPDVMRNTEVAFIISLFAAISIAIIIEFKDELSKI